MDMVSLAGGAGRNVLVQSTYGSSVQARLVVCPR